MTNKNRRILLASLLLAVTSLIVSFGVFKAGSSQETSALVATQRAGEVLPQAAPPQEVLGSNTAVQNSTKTVAKKVVIKSSNDLVNSGFSRQIVKNSRGAFTVSYYVTNSDTTRVVIDTASDSDCEANCPAKPLEEYVRRNNGLAGINGGYFCPPDYSFCSGRVNNFDTLVMNKNKQTFNLDHNYKTSPVPLMVVSGGDITFYDHTSEWSLDKSRDGVLGNHPMLVRGGRSVVNEGALEEKLRSGRGSKGFIGKKGNRIIIGVVHSATVPEEASVLETLKVEYGLNLDGGGSTALFSDGSYKLGPGRLLPVAVVLVRK
jgi:exopolysaccharide biosynthesis protein